MDASTIIAAVLSNGTFEFPTKKTVSLMGQTLTTGGKLCGHITPVEGGVSIAFDTPFPKAAIGFGINATITALDFQQGSMTAHAVGPLGVSVTKRILLVDV